MLRSRWLSTFTVIGAILIVLGIVGLILGPRFVYDPGQPVTGKEAWCYLAIGALMIMNGLMTPAPEEKPQAKGPKPGARQPAARPAAITPVRSTSNGTGKPSGQDAPVPAEKTE